MSKSSEAPAFDLEAHLGYWMRRVSNHVSAGFARSLRLRNVSVAEWVILSQIYNEPGIKLTQLAEILGLTRGAVSKVLDKLEKKKWITRRTLAGDNRVQQLFLSAPGRRTLPQLAEIADRNDESFFACLDAGEKTIFRQLLQKLTDSNQIRDVPIE